MKKYLSIIISVSMLVSSIVLPVLAEGGTENISYNYTLDIGAGYKAADTHTRAMEKLDRGLIAVNSYDGVYLSWRLFDSEDAVYGSAGSNVEFKIYRDGVYVDTVSDKTNYTDKTVGASYSVAPVINGIEGEKCTAVSTDKFTSGQDFAYFDIPLTTPEPETIYKKDSSEKVGDFNFSPTDCSTGDLDGDGEYEIIMKWVSSEQDVGKAQYSGTVRLAAYKLNGQKLWTNDIALGKNVYSSAHTVQFLVYDFDSDGKAEVMCQTSLGSKDAAGKYVSHAATDSAISSLTDTANAEADFRRTDGMITSGQEFLTVFNGETGQAIHTIDLPTSRGGNDGIQYGDTSGNRSNRFVADVAYLDGEKPYAVYLRGYYFGRNGMQRTSIAGISFNGTQLSPVYRFDTQYGEPGYYEGADNFVGNGNHNCTVADVDNDGKDEFITGALCMEVDGNNEFRPLWCTYKEHGDALHIGDYDPTNTGLEFFTIHEDGNKFNCDYGMSVIDAKNGNIMFHNGADGDTGRGIMANVGASGFFQIKSANAGSYKSNGGNDFTQNNVLDSMNFRIFWDGDLYDELLDGTRISAYNEWYMVDIFNAGYSGGCVSINGTKSNPSLQADLFGDWREEVVYPRKSDNNLKACDTLRVFTSLIPSDYKIKTLMHDPVYRSGVAAEQTAYNQPPHVGFYMDEIMLGEKPESISITHQPDRTVYLVGEEFKKDGLVVSANYSDGSSKDIAAYSISGFNSDTAGAQTVTVGHLGCETTFDVSVEEPTELSITKLPAKTEYLIGEDLDLNGLEVTASSANTSGVITNYNVDADLSTGGEKTVTITSSGLSAEFKITVREIVSITAAAKRPAYGQGYELSIDDLNITATYTDGTSSAAPERLTRCFSDNSTVKTLDTVGTMDLSVKVSYGNYGYYSYYTNFSVNVEKPSIELLNGLYASGSSYDVLVNNQTGTFTVTHDLVIDKLDGTAELYFSSTEIESPSKKLTLKEGRIYWDNTIVAEVQTGKTYKLKYDFTEIGKNASSVSITVCDENGAEINVLSDLRLIDFISRQPLNKFTIVCSDSALTISNAATTYTDRVIGETETKKYTAVKARNLLCEESKANVSDSQVWLNCYDKNYGMAYFGFNLKKFDPEKVVSAYIEFAAEGLFAQFGRNRSYEFHVLSADNSWEAGQEIISNKDPYPSNSSIIETLDCSTGSPKFNSTEYQTDPVGFKIGETTQIDVTSYIASFPAGTREVSVAAAIKAKTGSVPACELILNSRPSLVIETEKSDEPEVPTVEVEITKTASKVRNEMVLNSSTTLESVNKLSEHKVFLNGYSDKTWYSHGAGYFGFEDIYYFSPDYLVSAELKFKADSYASPTKDRPFVFSLFPISNNWESGATVVTNTPYQNGTPIWTENCKTNKGKGDVFSTSAATRIDVTEYAKTLYEGMTEISFLAAIKPESSSGAGACELYLNDDPTLTLVFEVPEDEEIPEPPSPTPSPSPSASPSTPPAPSDKNEILVSVTDLTVKLPTVQAIEDIKVYAAKYEDGRLQSVKVFSPSKTQDTTSLPFEPDKVFVWTKDMQPVIMWSKQTLSGK